MDPKVQGNPKACPGVLRRWALCADRDSSWGNTGNTAWLPLPLCPWLHLLSAAGHTGAVGYLPCSVP